MATNVGPQWEPSAEQVEALAKELCAAHCEGTIYGVQWPNLKGLDARNGYRAEARFVLRRQHERESILRDAMMAAKKFILSGCGHFAGERLVNALAAHAKLDAPKVPTLLGLVEAFDAAHGGVSGRAKLDALDAIRAYAKAAVEREEHRA